MTNSKKPFEGSDYVTGTQTNATTSTPPQSDQFLIGLNRSAELVMEGRPPTIKIEQSKYGTGKPHRLLVKGKILNG
jgi:hypothetical protein